MSEDVSEVDQWMIDRMSGLSFLDVGGLWGTTGEKVSLAAKNGARSYFMVDHTEEVSWWAAFEQRMKDLGVDNYGVIKIDVEEVWFNSHVKIADMTHCNGLLYHSANPMLFLQQLASVTSKYLVLGSVHSGRYNCSSELSVFVPGCPRNYTRERYDFPDKNAAYGISVPETDWMVNGRPNARPYWWLHSKTTIQTMLGMVGFSVERVVDVWDGRVAYFLCTKEGT